MLVTTLNIPPPPAFWPCFDLSITADQFEFKSCRLIVLFVNMSGKGYDTRNKIACVKCKQRHKPPVGVSWRIKAVKKTRKVTGNARGTALLADAMLGTSHASVERSPSPVVHKPVKKSKRPTNLEVIEKLSAVMDRFDDLKKGWNSRKEKAAVRFQSFHNCQPTAHPKRKLSSHNSTSSSRQNNLRKQLPAMEDLRGDSEIQTEVDRHLPQYEEHSRDKQTGTSNKLKSGCYR